MAGKASKRYLLIHEAQQGCRDATYEPSRFPVAVPYPSPHRATPAYVVVTSSDLDTSRNKASVSGLSWISRKRYCHSRRITPSLEKWRLDHPHDTPPSPRHQLLAIALTRTHHVLATQPYREDCREHSESCLSMKVRSPMPCSCSCLSPARSQRRRRELHGADSDMAQRLETAMAHTLRLGSLAELHG